MDSGASHVRRERSIRQVGDTNGGQTTNVLYVTNQNAKTVKTALEYAGFLDKTYRMTKADGSILPDPSGHIAVPVTTECCDEIQREGEPPAWYSLVVAIGEQEVPFSTAMLGRQKK